MKAMEQALNLDDDALELSWKSLREFGNELVLRTLRSQRYARRPPGRCGTHGGDGASVLRRTQFTRGGLMMTEPLYWYAALFSLLQVSAFELGRSKRNTQALMERAPSKSGQSITPVMAALHTTWLFACLAGHSPNRQPLRYSLWNRSVLAVAGQCLRIIAMSTLGERWTTRIIVLPGEDVVATGIFRHIRRPNYLGVILEIAALPLIFGGWKTALGFSVANGVLLWVRIRAEEKALSTEGDYQVQFEGQIGFYPLETTHDELRRMHGSDCSSAQRALWHAG